MENTQGIQESGVTQEGASSPEPTPPVSAQPENSQESVEKPAPFHEHPRFKELISQKNDLSQKVTSYEKSIQQMQEQMKHMQDSFNNNKSSKPSYEQLLARLQTIDPEFGQFQSKIAEDIRLVPELKQELETFKQWRQEVELQQIRVQAEKRLEDLYTQNKVPDNRKDFYRAQIERLANSTPGASLQHLDSFFKTTHDSLSKFFDDYDRQLTKSYSSDKKKDSVPAMQSGGSTVPANNASKKDNPLSFDEKVKLVAEGLRRGKEVI